MKVAQLLSERQAQWSELDRLCRQIGRRRATAEATTRFASLYRAACADLALADAYQLPPNTVHYLHQLVGRAHNQLYRSRRFDVRHWRRVLLIDVPQQLFHDRCVQLAFVLFWVTFLASALLAYNSMPWVEHVMPPGMVDMLRQSFNEPLGGRPVDTNYQMVGFYIQHNTSIGLRCFAWGILVVPGLYETLSNAVVLGASFGFMGRPDVEQGRNFFEFVTAHGPFELTAIVVGAGAGLRLGLGWIRTNGRSRSASLQQTAREAMPLMGVAMILFFLAAMIEGLLSPTSAPYWLKAGVAILSSGMLMFYFVVLGYPRDRSPGDARS